MPQDDPAACNQTADKPITAGDVLWILFVLPFRVLGLLIAAAWEEIRQR